MATKAGAAIALPLVTSAYLRVERSGHFNYVTAPLTVPGYVMTADLPAGALRKNGIWSEYEFRRGVSGKYAGRNAQGTNVVPLDPDVAKVFPDAASVNRALRPLAEIAGKQRKRGARWVWCGLPSCTRRQAAGSA